MSTFFNNINNLFINCLLNLLFLLLFYQELECDWNAITAEKLVLNFISILNIAMHYIAKKIGDAYSLFCFTVYKGDAMKKMNNGKKL